MSATLKDVAEACGMSIRTVRRVLDNAECVKAGTRERISAAARELGYVPNIAARNLRMGKKPFIGLISGSAGNESFVRRHMDLVTRLSEAGYETIIAAPPANADEACRMLSRWTGITDTVIWQHELPEGLLDRMDEIRQRFILVDSNIRAEKCCSLRMDRLKGIREALESLKKSGRHRIMRCGGIISRDEAFLEAFPETDVFAPDFFIRLQDLDFEGGYAAAEQIVKSGADAVFFDVDRIAYGFLLYAYENGIRIPEDIAVIGFDDDTFSRFSCPPLSSVAHPITEMNRKIVELIRSGTPESGIWTFSTSFVERASSAPRMRTHKKPTFTRRKK